MTFVRTVSDVFKALKYVKGLIKLCCSLITVSNITVCDFALFFSPFFYACLSFIHALQWKQIVSQKQPYLVVCPSCCHSKYRKYIITCLNP